MTTDTASATHATAMEIAEVLGIPTMHIDIDEANNTVTLRNGEARRLLALARKAADAFLVLDESDGVEVLAALAFAAQIYATTGNKVTADHYSGLHATLQFVGSGS